MLKPREKPKAKVSVEIGGNKNTFELPNGTHTLNASRDGEVGGPHMLKLTLDSPAQQPGERGRNVHQRFVGTGQPGMVEGPKVTITVRNGKFVSAAQAPGAVDVEKSDNTFGLAMFGPNSKGRINFKIEPAAEPGKPSSPFASFSALLRPKGKSSGV